MELIFHLYVKVTTVDILNLIRSYNPAFRNIKHFILNLYTYRQHFIYKRINLINLSFYTVNFCTELKLIEIKYV